MSDEELRRGITYCLENDPGDGWPPELPEFLRHCRKPKRENAAMYSSTPLLPAPHSSPETARFWITEMRKKVKP